jgi:glycosyltransferase involved in cell wall biosynthesis
MEIEIKVEELQKKKLFVATPMYGGQCNGMYTRSMCDLTAMCLKYGIEMKSYFLFNESLITRARNYCVDEFLRSGFTHLLFIDSDIGFNPQDVLALLAMQTDESNYDIIGGAYPKKCITWEKIKAAVDRGMADENPNALEDFVGDFVFNPVMPEGNESMSIRLDEPAEVLEIGTGFMMIRRKTFETYAKQFPNIQYRPDHVRTAEFDGSREIGMYFQAEIDPASKRYLSEDYLFCQNSRKANMKVWICPWMHLQHAGFYTFGGKLSALATIGASATADPSQLNKPKK